MKTPYRLLRPTTFAFVCDASKPDVIGFGISGFLTGEPPHSLTAFPGLKPDQFNIKRGREITLARANQRLERRSARTSN
jgi:hypothetical protein